MSLAKLERVNIIATESFLDRALSINIAEYWWNRRRSRCTSASTSTSPSSTCHGTLHGPGYSACWESTSHTIGFTGLLMASSIVCPFLAGTLWRLRNLLESIIPTRVQGVVSFPLCSNMVTNGRPICCDMVFWLHFSFCLLFTFVLQKWTFSGHHINNTTARNTTTWPLHCDRACTSNMPALYVTFAFLLFRNNSMWAAWAMRYSQHLLDTVTPFFSFNQVIS